MTAEPDRDDAPSLEIMRQAARQCIRVHGLRAFTAAIGMGSASGVAKMVNGESDPRPTTRQKLETWYVESYLTSTLKGDAAGAGLVATKVLFCDLASGPQGVAALRLQERLQEWYGELAGNVPGWVVEMRRLIETEWSD